MAQKNWPRIKSCVEFAWSAYNEDKWDPDKTGVITGRAHHTLDVELFGAHPWLTGFYHGALLAAASMALAMDERETHEEYIRIYERGHRYVEENCYNGKFYVQHTDLRDGSILDAFTKDAREYYWDESIGEMKYQIGAGCEIDQVLAGWHGELMGLGDIFTPEHRKSALRSIYRLNFKDMRDYSNPCRVFACDGERGLVMCAWKSTKEKPAIPIPYAEEVMTGFEYAAAGSMLQCGMEKEALEIVSAVRDRYDGAKRNPFAEIECGASYARAMASYALLLIYSGFRFDMTRGMLGFAPLHPGQYLWTAPTAWGVVVRSEGELSLRVLMGKLELRALGHDIGEVQGVSLNAKSLPYTAHEGEVHLCVALGAGDVLSITQG